MKRARILPLAAGLAMAGVICAALVASHAPRARAWMEQLVVLAETNAANSLIWFALVQIAVAACGILPAAIVAVMAGAIYGLWQGMAISVVCTMLGGWLAFLLSRSVLRPYVAGFLGRYAASARFDRSVGQEGWRFVCLLRISPVMPFAATSYGLGLTKISQRDFLLGTFASLPSLLGYVALGAFGMEGFMLGAKGAAPLQWGLLAVGALTVVWAMMRVSRAMKLSLAADPA